MAPYESTRSRATSALSTGLEPAKRKKKGAQGKPKPRPSSTTKTTSLKQSKPKKPATEQTRHKDDQPEQQPYEVTQRCFHVGNICGSLGIYQHIMAPARLIARKLGIETLPDDMVESAGVDKQTRWAVATAGACVYLTGMLLDKKVSFKELHAYTGSKEAEVLLLGQAWNRVYLKRRELVDAEAVRMGCDLGALESQ